MVTYVKGDGDNKMKATVKVTNDPKLQEKSYEYELGKEFECDDIDGQHFKVGNIGSDIAGEQKVNGFKRRCVCGCVFFGRGRVCGWE